MKLTNIPTLIQSPTSPRAAQIFPQRRDPLHMNGPETDPAQEVESFQKYSKIEENAIFMEEEQTRLIKNQTQ